MSNAAPIGKIAYYALRIEFQMRGSPHSHALIWTADCPKFDKNMEAYSKYIDQHVQVYLPNKNTESELHDMVVTYQKHSHSKTCTKYKNVQCRFNFGQFFTDRTIVAKPLNNDLYEEVKVNILKERSNILNGVKAKINGNLDPNKSGFPNLTIAEFLTSTGISE